MQAAQRTFLLFALFNVISFQFLSGNIITLYALRLGAGSFLVGLLYSFIPLAQVLPAFGQLIVRRLGSVRTMGIFWLLRYVLTAPILAAPLFATQQPPRGAILLIVISVLGFNLARGIGISGHNPVIGGITGERDRGAFISRFQMLIHVTSIFTGLVIALLLDYESPLFMYTVVLGVGVVAGLAASYVLFRLPEPPESKEASHQGLLVDLREALQRPGFRHFMLTLLASYLVLFLVQPFLIVFARQVYGQGDDTIMLFTVVGSLGAVLMALVSGFMVDRLGAKPLMFLFGVVLTLVVVLMVVAPPLSAPAAIWIFAGVMFFFYTLGFSGISNSATVYFFSSITAAERVSLGAAYFVATGISGFVGSILGGLLLDLLQRSLAPGQAFQAYFALVLVPHLLVLMMVRRLKQLGSYGIRDVLSTFVSLRDLRSLGLLNRMEKLKSPAAEQQAIHALGAFRSDLSRKQLLGHLSSPRFAVRAEALTALHGVTVDDELAGALISEIRNHAYTTAYLAADLAGRKQVKQATEALRQALDSRDYFLSGKAMVSLARLGDSDSVPRIEEILEQTQNPRLIIHAATALEVLGSVASVPLLIAKLHRKYSPFVRDELILAVATILGLGDFFHTCYLAFLQKASLGLDALEDHIASREAAGGNCHPPGGRLRNLLSLMTADRQAFLSEVALVLAQRRVLAASVDVTETLVDSTLRPELARLDRYCFLMAALVVWRACSKTDRP